MAKIKGIDEAVKFLKQDLKKEAANIDCMLNLGHVYQLKGNTRVVFKKSSGAKKVKYDNIILPLNRRKWNALYVEDGQFK